MLNTIACLQIHAYAEFVINHHKTAVTFIFLIVRPFVNTVKILTEPN